jgi:hypothetical protein
MPIDDLDQCDYQPLGLTAKMTSREMTNPAALRRLAAWYRESAERTENPTIWEASEARLRVAEDLEAGASRIEAAAPQNERVIKKP